MKIARAMKSMKNAGMVVEIKTETMTGRFGQGDWTRITVTGRKGKYFMSQTIDTELGQTADQVELRATGWYAGNVNDPVDSMTDYFPGLWCARLKHAIGYCTH